MKLGYEDEPVIEEVDEDGEDPEGTEFIPLDGSKWIEMAENDQPLETSNSPSPARSRSQSPARASPSWNHVIRNAPISVGQTVRIPIPSVDRAKTDPRNLLGVVMGEEDGFYRIGTDNGILSQQYSRNQIEPSSPQFVSKENVPDKEISLRATVGADSLSGGQGHKHCNCFRGCVTGKCNCRSLGRLCNSRCHNSTSCKNK
ncbi:hypothetical protein DdX_14732 [Ditylenchus destructor]|uniref:Uncharacterized protein n=1 Tax=Ditylenchus destructor TaxID=166010 RepID=A0AAD4MTG4_9BILA|nr:hypothetical protein DdX_14732 [Ditylenchus destructor]